MSEQKQKTLHITYALLLKRAEENLFDGLSHQQRIDKINGYREEGYSAQQCGLDMGLVGYEEIYSEEDYEKAHASSCQSHAVNFSDNGA